MPQSKGKQGSPAAEPVAAREVVNAKSAPVGAAVVSKCEATLARIIELAAALAKETREKPRAARAESSRTESAGTMAEASSTAKSGPAEQLAAALHGLEPEMALKLRTLMIAGRDGQSIAAVKVNVSLSDADAGFAILADDSSENGPLLVDYMRRGHAIACAAGINLDGPLSEWQSSGTPDLAERAWLSFGKQLASSTPSDWQCLGIVESPSQGFSKLYLRLGKHAWWSFQAVLDRPTTAGVEKERRALAKRRIKGISSDSLEALVGQFGGTQGRALRRAGRAICARVGRAAAAAAPR